MATAGGELEPEAEVGSGGSVRRRGRCKWFNVAKGWGFLTPVDGGQDVFVHQSVIQMSGFRSLGDDEILEFEAKESDKGLEATLVTAIGGGDCKGSNRRPLSKKKFRKVRCYNCGEFANHIAAKCSMGPQPKRCHQCKGDDHLIADCPEKKILSSSDEGNGSQSLKKVPKRKVGSNGAGNKPTSDDARTMSSPSPITPSPTNITGEKQTAVIAISSEEYAIDKTSKKEVPIDRKNGSSSSVAVTSSGSDALTRQHSSSTSSGGSANGKVTKL